MTSEAKQIFDDPVWFGSLNAPLFGWLSRPATSPVIGGVVIVPPVGYEARNARATLRYLAHELARCGFLALRFDLRGTGDSAQEFNEVLPSPDWSEDVAIAVQLLRSSGVKSVSLVGMRLGATLVAMAASDATLNLSSIVMWDPCESGGSYLRELSSLESLRREQFIQSEDGSVETAEYLFTPEMAAATRSLKMSVLTEAFHAKRMMVVTRSTRPLSSKLHEHLSSRSANFVTTVEQEALLEVLPFAAEVPAATVLDIIAWLREDVHAEVVNSVLLDAETILASDEGKWQIRERAIFLGSHRLFAMVSEPLVPLPGPWIVLLGNVHDDLLASRGCGLSWLGAGRERVYAALASISRAWAKASRLIPRAPHNRLTRGGCAM